jgi:hypothetical protein
MSGPCTIVIHSQAIFIKWDFIFNKGLKRLPVILLNVNYRFKTIYVQEFLNNKKRGNDMES